MSEWLAPLRRSLDAASSPVRFFFRDDDAGWEDARLFALLDVFEESGQPVDVAAIPRALSRATARELGRRADARVGLLGVHQHGFAHVDHEPVGRRCEFGSARPRDAQRDDIARGERRLRELLGARLDPIFTPPWNRCSEVTPRCLLELGFRALSRDRSAAPVAMPGLCELPIAADWLKRRRGRRIALAELGGILAASARAEAVVGVMLHHAVMDEPDRCALATLLALVRQHPRARGTSMRELLPPPEGWPREGRA